MSFPVPQPSITSPGEQRSRESLANDAAAARREAQIQHALSQETQPHRMITTITTPTEQELAHQRNERIRLRGHISADYRAQLEAIGQERQNTGDRLASSRRQREAALRQGHVHDVKTFGAHIENLTIVLEQLALVKADAETGLAEAEAREARQDAALRAQIPAAEKTLLRHLKAVQDYAEHAQAIAELVAGEPEAEAAHRLLCQVARRFSGERRQGHFPSGLTGRYLG